MVRDGGEVRFAVTDGGASLPVVFSGILARPLPRGPGRHRHRHASRAAPSSPARSSPSHDESYMPKEVADALKEQGLFRYGGGVAEKPGS